MLKRQHASTLFDEDRDLPPQHHRRACSAFWQRTWLAVSAPQISPQASNSSAGSTGRSTAGTYSPAS